ncbi:LCP family protein [Streptomyces sp. TRM64462]|uniref:LCP family protein n=1 Tax=Streptomyces sp. TRM64462 TaxID=2741726 RepID=UPI001586F853|nr:LCP family protein [Streptomyces sp. TRM64462]
MNDWPEGWSDDRNARHGRGSADAQPEGHRVMRHVRPGSVPRQGVPPQPQQPPRSPRSPDGYANAYDSGYNTGQVYGSPRGGGNNPGGYGPGGPGGRGPGGAPPMPSQSPGARPAPNWGRRIKVGSITLAVVVLATTVGTYFWADGKMRREVDLAKVIDRPAEGDCTTYLIVGSDSREGMTSEDKKRLHTGSADGKRTDSMMILAACGSGNTMISLPRDSDVEIPTFVGSESGKTFKGTGRRVKLNAAYAEDGPELLVRTVEHNTGLRIDHYAEIGFAGFANIVDALGGVEMNIEKGFKDKKSGADFQAGKQTLDGEQALAFVRTRYAFAESDLARTKNQQKFLAALANQAATPGTILNPFKLYPTLGAGLDTLIVDKDMSLFDLGEMFFAMKGVNSGDGTSMNMPISGSRGGNLVWDKAKVRQLVQQIQNDEKVTVTSDR